MKKQNKTTITKNTKRKKKKRKKEKEEKIKKKRLFARNSAPRKWREIFLPLRHVGS